MFRLQRYLAIALLLTCQGAAAQWENEEGLPRPVTDYRKEQGRLGAQLVLLDEKQREYLLGIKNSLSNTFYIDSTNNIGRDEPLTAAIVFTGCQADAAGNCHLISKYQVYKPDGSLYADIPALRAWYKKPAPVGNEARLTSANIKITIEQQDPLGTYKVIAKLVDVHSRKAITLSHDFEVKAEGIFGFFR